MIFYNYTELKTLYYTILMLVHIQWQFLKRVIHAFSLKCKAAELSLTQSWSSEADTLQN
jgi:hypothetical protein